METITRVNCLFEIFLSFSVPYITSFVVLAVFSSVLCLLPWKPLQELIINLLKFFSFSVPYIISLVVLAVFSSVLQGPS